MSLRIASTMCGSVHHTIQVHLAGAPTPTYRLMKQAWLQWHTPHTRTLHMCQPARCLAGPDAPSPADALPAALYLVATPIGNLDDMSTRALHILRDADLVLAEDTRHTRKLFARYSISTPMQSYHEHNERQRTPLVVQRVLQGESVALVSDAGMPGISDPGTLLVAAAVDAGAAVIPIPGPCAFVTALAASGLSTDACHFAGFLPPKQAARRAALERLAVMPSTVAVYVAPHALRDVLKDMAHVVGVERRIVLARELTKVHEEFLRGSVQEVMSHYEEREPRGEYVLLLEGVPSIPAGAGVGIAVGIQWEQALTELLAGGMKPSAAAKTVASWFGVSRKQVYSVALMMVGASWEQDE